jgi:tripartite-type tricarboxylate transporter receptor subunit TctC
MKTKVLVSLFLVAGILLGTTLSGFTAETYPSKPVRLIVPYAPGGGTDLVARTIGQWLTKKWGQQVVVDNRAGGTTIIGTEIAARSPADGYTWLLASVPFSTNPSTKKKLPYDPLKDFTPVIQTTLAPYLIAANPSLPVRSVQELITYLRSKPDVKLKYGTSGTGSGLHLSGELFKLKNGIKNLVHVPYRGIGPATTDLLGGHIQITFTTLLPVVEHIKAGALRGLSVLGTTRLPSLPDLPTVGESGVPGVEASSWNGIIVPTGVPAHIVTKVNKDIIEALKAKEVRAVLETDGAQVVGGTPEEFGLHIRSEIQKWREVIRSTDIPFE